MTPEKILERYDMLWQCLQGRHNAMDFYEFDDWHYQIFGRMHTLCYYKRLLIKKSFDIQLTDKQTEDLKKLTLKYGKTEITYLIPMEEMPSSLHNRAMTELFKGIYGEMSDLTKDSSPAFSEYNDMLAENQEFAYDNRDNLALNNINTLNYIADIDNLFNGTPFKLNDNLTIQLTINGFIHVLTGHSKTFKIPRKGLLADFDGANHWLDVLYLLRKIILHIKEDIISSFENHHRYDNRKIFFEGKFYGLHINKNKTISTFYPVVIKNKLFPFQE